MRGFNKAKIYFEKNHQTFQYDEYKPKHLCNTKLFKLYLFVWKPITTNPTLKTRHNFARLGFTKTFMDKENCFSKKKKIIMDLIVGHQNPSGIRTFNYWSMEENHRKL